ncbi:helix-turn-helix domain-containing protein [Streptomyces sp. NPDC059215]|uniref:helix-turn-helix domain-containing protein n=1 Tax=Streptomyces sp. NPDC059215 TaxID=3346772 RepID=UPI0036B71BD9
MPSWDARQGEPVPSQEEVEEFAALLRRLKARTDRSYAALARRLNMNASTLHRYCAGDAVPLDFAPVERFAAMCEAGPAERIELHRRWILAVAARQRPRTATESVAATVLPSVTGAAPGPSPEPRQTLSESLAGSPESLAGSSPEPGAPSHPVSRKPRYRRRVAVTSAVVTALVVTLGTVSALLPGHSWTTGDDHRTSGTASAGARHGFPTPSPPHSGTHHRPAGTPPAKEPGTDGRSSSPSTKHSATAVPTAPPLTWTANSQVWELGCNHDYVIGKAPERVPPPPAPQDAAPWARTQGAVHGGQTLVSVSVQGRTDAAVVLEALRVRVVGRTAPMKGTVYSTGQGCGSDMNPRSFAVDLDKDRPIARSVKGSDNGANTPAIRMPYRVSSKDPEVLLVDARTVHCDCRWYLELDWSSQGRTGTERIDDHGLAFRTSGIKGLPRYWFAQDGWTPLTT